MFNIAIVRYIATYPEMKMLWKFTVYQANGVVHQSPFLTRSIAHETNGRRRRKTDETLIPVVRFAVLLATRIDEIIHNMVGTWVVGSGSQL